jgi:hypothetical protein
MVCILLSIALLIYLTMLFTQDFHGPDPTMLLTQYTNQGPELIQTIIGRAWWDTQTPSSMLPPFIYNYQRSLRDITCGPEDKHVSTLGIRLDHILTSKPSVRKQGTTLQKSYVAL